MPDKKLLEIRNRIKRKKPVFKRQDYGKKIRLDGNWRRPRGWQNKVRLNIKGHYKKVQVGYGSPAETKGLTRQGFVPVIISSMSQLSEIDKKTEGAVIASGVGNRKLALMLEYAEKEGITIINHKVKEKIESIKKEIGERKTRKAEKKKAEKEKEKAKKEKKSIEEKVEHELSDEEKKKAEKDEKDKVLTKKGAM